MGGSAGQTETPQQVQRRQSGPRREVRGRWAPEAGCGHKVISALCPLGDTRVGGEGFMETGQPVRPSPAFTAFWGIPTRCPRRPGDTWSTGKTPGLCVDRFANQSLGQDSWASARARPGTETEVLSAESGSRPYMRSREGPFCILQLLGFRVSLAGGPVPPSLRSPPLS